jgi:transcriptional regulator with XRE-family HTH domain
VIVKTTGQRRHAGSRIQARREFLGISRVAFGKRLKPRRNRVWVWRIETGKTPITEDVLHVCARALDTTAAELVA